LEGLELRDIVVDDVWIIGVVHEVVLMVVLGGIEGPQGRDFGHDWGTKSVMLFKVGDEALRLRALRVGSIEDLRAILRSLVRTLTVEFGWVVRDEEVDVEKIGERNLGRIVADVDRLRVTGRTGAHDLVVSSRSSTAREAGNYVRHSAERLEYGLHAPKTATGEDDVIGSGCGRSARYGEQGGEGECYGSKGLHVLQNAPNVRTDASQAAFNVGTIPW
jgi:hypothetical protein